MQAYIHTPFGLILIQKPYSTHRTSNLRYDKTSKMAYQKPAIVHVFSLECPLPYTREVQIPPPSDRHDMMSDMRKLSSFVDLCISVLSFYPTLYFPCKDKHFQVPFKKKKDFQLSSLFYGEVFFASMKLLLMAMCI